jgi:hypothetical protein
MSVPDISNITPVQVPREDIVNWAFDVPDRGNYGVEAATAEEARTKLEAWFLEMEAAGIPY